MLPRSIFCALVLSQAAAFTIVPNVDLVPPTRHRAAVYNEGSTRLAAGGFEWEDPGESFDQGVENPFKNSDLMQGEEGMKIDPARLLGPRLGGSNLYFVGMMGVGKSAVGDRVARREYYENVE